MSRPFLVRFPEGQQARAIRIAGRAALPGALRRLGLEPPRPTLLLLTGAAGLEREPECMARLQPLFDGLARVAEATGAAVVDGGTASGGMRLMGQARADAAGCFPLLGVAAAAMVRLPGAPPTTPDEDRCPLDPHHTHFVLVPGDRWGSESPWLAAAAEVLARGAPAVAVLVGGGDICRHDAALSLAAGRPLVVVAGSGGRADELAATARGHPLLHVARLAARPEAVVAALLAGACALS